MKQSNEENTRFNHHKKRQSDRLVNWLIGAVVIALVFTAWLVLSPDDKEQADKKPPTNDNALTKQKADEQEDDLEGNLEDKEQNAVEDTILTDEGKADESEQAEVEVIESSTDAFVLESRIDPSWEPIGTAQTGPHVSLYDGTSVDWKEKEQALLYATGLTDDNVIFWKIRNGGEQKSIGILSSMDKVEKYRVYLEWIDGEGWKPVQLDMLKTLDIGE